MPGAIDLGLVMLLAQAPALPPGAKPANEVVAAPPIPPTVTQGPAPLTTTTT
jgi:hypothetical protein